MGGKDLIGFYSYNWTQAHKTIDSVKLQSFHLIHITYLFFLGQLFVIEASRADTAEERMLVPTIGRTVMLNRKYESLIPLPCLIRGAPCDFQWDIHCWLFHHIIFDSVLNWYRKPPYTLNSDSLIFFNVFFIFFFFHMHEYMHISFWFFLRLK